MQTLLLILGLALFSASAFIHPLNHDRRPIPDKTIEGKWYRIMMAVKGKEPDIFGGNFRLSYRSKGELVLQRSVLEDLSCVDYSYQIHDAGDASSFGFSGTHITVVATLRYKTYILVRADKGRNRSLYLLGRTREMCPENVKAFIFTAQFLRFSLRDIKFPPQKEPCPLDRIDK